MPPLPKRKRSTTRNAKRLSHTALRLQSTSACPVCGNPKLSHRACRVCGTYNGRQVIQPRQGETEAS